MSYVDVGDMAAITIILIEVTSVKWTNVKNLNG